MRALIWLHGQLHLPEVASLKQKLPTYCKYGGNSLRQK